MTCDKFRQRMSDSQLLDKEIDYPVKIIGSKSIVNYDEKSRNRQKFNYFEQAIKERQRVEIEYIVEPWNYENKHQLIYPLQIVFHRYAWYLGYEVIDKKHKGLLYFERLDRIKVKEKGDKRSTEKHKSALENLNYLYNASAGIYLGRSVEAQKSFLEYKFKDKNNLKITLYGTDKFLRFLGETSKRFLKDQIKMADTSHIDLPLEKETNSTLKPVNNRAPHLYPVHLTFPKWSINDIYLFNGLFLGEETFKLTKSQRSLKKLPKEVKKFKEFIAIST